MTTADVHQGMSEYGEEFLLNAVLVFSKVKGSNKMKE